MKLKAEKSSPNRRQKGRRNVMMAIIRFEKLEFVTLLVSIWTEAFTISIYALTNELWAHLNHLNGLCSFFPEIGNVEMPNDENY